LPTSSCSRSRPGLPCTKDYATTRDVEQPYDAGPL
jgi:hypothetical protein